MKNGHYSNLSKLILITIASLGFSILGQTTKDAQAGFRIPGSPIHGKIVYSVDVVDKVEDIWNTVTVTVTGRIAVRRGSPGLVELGKFSDADGLARQCKEKAQEAQKKGLPFRVYGEGYLEPLTGRYPMSPLSVRITKIDGCDAVRIGDNQ